MPRANVRWLRLAAASAGAGAAVVGATLLGPQVGVASADPTDQTSASSSTGESSASVVAPRRARLAEARKARAAEADSRRAERRLRGSASVSDDPASAAAAEDTPTAADSLRPQRRALGNKAPTVAPEQLTGVLEGPITGTVGAVDPEGDPLRYKVIRSPRSGSVVLGDDGTYTYTAGSSFTGVDTFRVIAIDEAAQPKFLRPVGTRATALINQDAVTFEFTYTEGSQYWTPERREALQDAANSLLVYFRVKKPVTLTYRVTGENDPEGDTLASAGSDFVSQRPGFWPLVVEKKLLTGMDLNGKAADGEIHWNFGFAWGLGDTVGADEYDFTSTAMHELLHSFGFLSGLQAPGDNASEPVWTVFDRFVRTADGRTPFTARSRWITRFDPALTGADGGLFFGGPQAVAAYGGLVPLYTPSPWEEGSSMSHLDEATFTGADEQLMNPRAGMGLGVRVLSPIEIGILRDLGYQVQPPVSALALVGLVFLRRRRRTLSR